MASPLDIFYQNGTNPNADAKQSATPNVPGSAGGPPPNAGILDGMSPAIMVVIALAIVWYAFMDDAKGAAK